MTSLDLFADPIALSAALVDIESPSHHEEAIADAVESALRGLEHAEVERFGNTVVARTNFRLGSRVVLAGHIDTVPLADLSLIHISEPTRRTERSRMPSSA